MLQLPSILHVKNAIKVDLSLLICTTEVGDCLSNILVVAVLNAFSWSREIFIFYVVYLIFCEVYFTLLNSSSRRCSAHSVLSFLGILGATMSPLLIISSAFSLSNNCSFLPLDTIISEQLKVLKTSF